MYLPFEIDGANQPLLEPCETDEPVLRVAQIPHGVQHLLQGGLQTSRLLARALQEVSQFFINYL